MVRPGIPLVGCGPGAGHAGKSGRNGAADVSAQPVDPYLVNRRGARTVPTVASLTNFFKKFSLHFLTAV